MITGQKHNTDLADFLRSRRVRLHPDDVGLHGTSRRHTEGLRREEVAELAQIGVTWYTWLEQGRDIRASPRALERIAEALRLTPDERTHLLALASESVPPKGSNGQGAVSPALQNVFHSISNPAFIRGPCWEILAWNDAATAIFGNPFSRPERERNSLFMMLDNRYLRALQVGWELQAREFLAVFRADYDRMIDQRERYDDLISRVRERSQEFDRWWSQHDVHHWGLPAGTYCHPIVGEFLLDRIELSADDSPGAHLIVFPPKPVTGSAEKLEALVRLYHAGRLDTDFDTTAT